MIRLGRNVCALAAIASLAALTTAAQADGHISQSTRELVEARQGGMTMSVFTLSALSNAAKGDKPLDGATFPASGLNLFAQSLPTLFGPETAAIEGTRALPAIWEEDSDFAARIGEYELASGELVAAAQANDRAAFTAALARTKNACKACHDSYRLEPTE